ncbi:unnamed protein product [Heterosigma akashiwo]
MALPKRTLTTDGFEYQFGVNHLGHFLLTNLLMGSLLKASGGKIVNLSRRRTRSPGTVDRGPYGREGLPAVEGLRAEQAGQHPVHEGAAAAAGRPDRRGHCDVLPPGRRAHGAGRNLDLPAWALPLLVPLVYFTKSVEQGAQTQTRSADPALHRVGAGKYFDNCAEAQPAPPALDAAAARRLWEVSEELTGQRFEI